MKKILTLVLTSTLIATTQAHSLWIVGDNSKDTLNVDMLYTHEPFPTREAIPEKRLSIFEAPEVHGKDFTETLSQQGENYHYVGKEKLKDGTYLLTAYYKPTTWVETTDGKWVMGKTRKDVENAASCETAVMQGKGILIVGGDDGAYAQTILGKGIEITPKVNAGELAVDKDATFVLTKEGKPLAGQVVLGSFDGYGFEGHNIPMAFYAKTNKNGEFIFRPTRSGLWYLTADVQEDSGNADCELNQTKVTLTFNVK